MPGTAQPGALPLGAPRARGLHIMGQAGRLKPGAMDQDPDRKGRARSSAGPFSRQQLLCPVCSAEQACWTALPHLHWIQYQGQKEVQSCGHLAPP